MSVYALDGVVPRIAAGAWIADSAQVIGNVDLDEEANIWFGAVVRGDNLEEPIRIGRGSNVQDAAVLHADPGRPLVLGEGVSIGHQAMVHGCTIGAGSLVGIRAVVMNGARVGRRCIVGAGALVTEGKSFDDGWLILGSPARAVRPLTPEQLADLERTARHYVANARRFRDGLDRIG